MGEWEYGRPCPLSTAPGNDIVSPSLMPTTWPPSTWRYLTSSPGAMSSTGIEQIMQAEPGTYLVTDFLVRGFHRTVMVELGLDRHPDLRDDYLGNYRRVVWLATRMDDGELIALGHEAAQALGLPLEIRPVGRERLAAAVGQILETTALR